MKLWNKLPDIHSKYFIRNGRGGRKDYGGYSPCTTGNKELFEGCTLNNCVGGAWGCMGIYENNPKETIGFIKASTYPQDAGSWYNDGQPSKWDKHERGKEPRLGAVICYTGHVAFVNEIKDNGDLVCISSAWKSKVEEGFEYVTVKKSTGYAWRSQLAGDFLGFIYADVEPKPEPEPDPKPEPEDDFKVGDEVQIMKPGNASSYGYLWKAYGIGWRRYITAIYPNRPYPYQVGFKGDTSSQGTTGFYKKEALKHV